MVQMHHRKMVLLVPADIRDVGAGHLKWGILTFIVQFIEVSYFITSVIMKLG